MINVNISEQQQRQQQQPESQKQPQRRSRSQRRLAFHQQRPKFWRNSKIPHNSSCYLWLLQQARGWRYSSVQRVVCQFKIIFVSASSIQRWTCLTSYNHLNKELWKHQMLQCWFEMGDRRGGKSIKSESVVFSWEIMQGCLDHSVTNMKFWYEYETNEYSWHKIFEYFRISEYLTHPGIITKSVGDQHGGT